jgi:RNA polymerase sigma-70 factor (ECF subfamily)
MVDDHWRNLGRILRSLGVAESDVDDALQQVFVTAAEKLELIRAESERAFLIQVAVRVAARHRRARHTRRETPDADAPLERADPQALPDAALDRERALRALDRVLAELEEDLREVFVLYEIEEMTMAEIAGALELPPGTVASRLRRARAEFEAGVARHARRTR